MLTRFVRVVVYFMTWGLLAIGIGPYNIAYFIDFPSALIVFGLTLLPLLAVFGLRPFKDIVYMAAGLPADYRLIRLWSQWAAVLSVVAGAVGSLIGMVLMLQNLDDPSALGPGMAVMLLTSIYGLVCSGVIFVPLLLWAMKKQRTETLNKPSEAVEPSDDQGESGSMLTSGVVVAGSVLVVLLTLILMFAMMVSLSVPMNR